MLMKTMKINRINKGDVLTNYSYLSSKLPKSNQTWYKIKAKTQPFYSVVGYVNDIIHILLNIYENIRIKRNIKEKLRGYLQNYSFLICFLSYSSKLGKYQHT